MACWNGEISTSREVLRLKEEHMSCGIKQGPTRVQDKCGIRRRSKDLTNWNGVVGYVKTKLRHGNSRVIRKGQKRNSK